METSRFDEVYKSLFKDVFRLVYSYVLNISDTEDILQKTFYKLYKNKKILKLSDIEIKKWLFRVSINETKDLKKLLKYRIHEGLDNIEYKTKESVSLINALSKIKKEYRIPLYLYYYEGYKVSEIAKIMKKSESNIKVRLHRGRELLKTEWRDLNE